MKTKPNFYLNLFLIFSLQLLHCINANAQIIYTDLVPDSVVSINGGVFNLDLNHDTINDFNFVLTKTNVGPGLCTGTKTNHSVKVSPADTVLDFVGNRLYSSVNYPALIVADSMINDINYNWIHALNENMSTVTWSCHRLKRGYAWSSATTGRWNSAVDKFLGLKFVVGTDTFYGWVRMTVGTTSFTINDFAYNSTPNALIFAGQKIDQFLTISPLSVSSFCPGNSISVNFTTFGNFDTSNVFTLQLSDSSGSFTNPIMIGSLHSDSSGTIVGTIPPGTVYGLLYKIRLVSSNPVLTANYGVNLIVNTSQASTHLTASASPIICPGTTVRLNAPNGSGYTFQWTIDSVNIPGATSYTILADTVGIYRCLVTNGCGTVLSDSIAVTFGPPPTYMHIQAADTTAICSGSNVTLYAPTGVNYSYQWSRDSINISNAVNSSIAADTIGNYRCYVTTGCGSVLSDSIDVTFSPSPAAAISPSGSFVYCPGQTLQLQANVGPGFTYQWFRNGVAITGATLAGYGALQSGRYSVQVFNSVGCDNISTADSLTLSLPSAIISAGGPVTFCVGDSVLLYSIAMNGSNITFQWYDSTLIPGATSSSYYATQSGSYYLSYTNPNGNCSRSSGVIQVSVGCTGIRENNSVDLQFNIHPNPASNFIVPDGQNKNEVSITITDQLGQIVFAENKFLQGNAIDITNLPEGVYAIQLTDGKNIRSRKFTVIR